MIELKEYHLALNSFDAPGYQFSMNVTWKMPRGARPRDMIYWIGYACDTSPEMYLRHVVVNSHGGDGKIYVGKSDDGQHLILDEGNVDLFSQLKNRSIGTIWLLGCELAKTAKGQRFLSKAAVNAGCDVIAADVIQEAWNATWASIFMPRGNIDDFEGKIYRFSPSGSQERFSPNGETF